MLKLCVTAESARTDTMNVKDAGFMCVAGNQEVRETGLKTNKVKYPELKLKVLNSHRKLFELLKMIYERSRPVTNCLFPVFLVLLQRHTHCCPGVIFPAGQHCEG